MAGRGAFSRLIAPGYRKVVFNAYKERPLEGQKLVNLNTSKRAYEEDFEVAGFGSLVAKAEGGSITYQDPIQGSAKRYVHSTFGLGYRITEEMMDDDLYGIIGNKLAKALGRSARNNREIIMHAPYNNAFSTSFVGFESGIALCSASHTVLRTGATVSNVAAADFGLTAYQAGLEHFHNLVEQSGMPLVIVPKILVHGISDQWQVSQVLKSNLLPGSQNNDINPVKGEGVTPHLSHYLTDTDAWFLIGDQHDVNVFDRKKFTFSNSDDFHTGDALFKGTQRLSSGFGDWRGIYGSSGA